MDFEFENIDEDKLNIEQELKEGKSDSIFYEKGDVLAYRREDGIIFKVRVGGNVDFAIIKNGNRDIYRGKEKKEAINRYNLDTEKIKELDKNDEIGWKRNQYFEFLWKGENKDSWNKTMDFVMDYKEMLETLDERVGENIDEINAEPTEKEEEMAKDMSHMTKKMKKEGDKTDKEVANFFLNLSDDYDVELYRMIGTLLDLQHRINEDNEISKGKIKKIFEKWNIGEVFEEEMKVVERLKKFTDEQDEGKTRKYIG